MTDMITALNRYHPKYALICRVMNETGLRVSDTLNLKRRDFERNNGVKMVSEKKTRKKRQFIISENLRNDILAFAKREVIRAEEFIFPSTDMNRCKSVSRHQVYKVFKRAAKAAGIEGVISPHSCRKTYARRKYQEHGDIFELQRDMRHTKMETTLGYLVDAPTQQKPNEDNTESVKIHPIFADILGKYGIT